MNIKIFGPLESPECLEQIKNCAAVDEAVGAALMGDHHLGYSMPIGGVVAYEHLVSPSGVGFDIACGNACIQLDVDASYVKENIKSIMDKVVAQISFGVGRNSVEPVEAEILEKDSHAAWSIPEIEEIRQKAAGQLGTVGSGNHYVDIFLGSDDKIWVGCHFGSRGLGHTIATRYLELAGASNDLMADPCLLDVNTDLGREYLLAMDLAGEYAYTGRRWVVNKVAEIIGGNITDRVHNHHNFAWEEEHNGKKFWVVRKGATPAFPGQRGFVGGSMGDNSVILHGVESEEGKDSFYSTVHGAGRVMSRTKASGKKKWLRDPVSGKKRPVIVAPGLVSQEMMRNWIDPLGVELRGAGTDESPHCYKRLNEVLEYHKNSIEIETILKPLGVAMAGDEFDPYKD
jgi:tRNA-splicing ligase RtcB (3'-phosphate/5'-hydroxy nucleic acid ligase)